MIALSAWSYLGITLVALALLWFFGGPVARDVGGYVSTFKQMDKAAHFALAGFLTFAAIVAHVPIVPAGVITIVVAVVGWEFVERYHRGYVAARRRRENITPGFWDWKDVAVGTGGVVLASVWALLCR